MTNKAWADAARKFRKKRGFPRNWTRYAHNFYYRREMLCFTEGFLQGYNASNVMWQKKKG